MYPHATYTPAMRQIQQQIDERNKKKNENSNYRSMYLTRESVAAGTDNYYNINDYNRKVRQDEQYMLKFYEPTKTLTMYDNSFNYTSEQASSQFVELMKCCVPVIIRNNVIDTRISFMFDHYIPIRMSNKSKYSNLFFNRVFLFLIGRSIINGSIDCSKVLYEIQKICSSGPDLTLGFHQHLQDVLNAPTNVNYSLKILPETIRYYCHLCGCFTIFEIDDLTKLFTVILHKVVLTENRANDISYLRKIFENNSINNKGKIIYCLTRKCKEQKVFKSIVLRMIQVSNVIQFS